MNLQLLQAYLAGLDPTKILPAGLTSTISFNQQLGYGKDLFSPFQFIPWGNWSNYKPTPGPVPSVLELSFAETIVQGHMVNQKVDPTNSFIDILHLGQPSSVFFTERLNQNDQPTQTLIETIASNVNAMNPNITPVIRFLVGNPTPPGTICPSNFTDVFWPGGKQIFNHPNAQLYVGTYNPNLTVTDTLNTTLVSWIDALVDGFEVDAINYLSYYSPDVAAYATAQLKDLGTEQFINSIIESYIKSHLNKVSPPISWNHAKIVAVNGRALLTGGGNYYDLYSTQGNGNLIDNDITILGDVARNAHNYADYLWTYLNKIPSYDTSSVVWSSKLATAAPNRGIPIFKGNVPLFPSKIPSNPGKIPVLSTNKVGNLQGPSSESPVVYPMQLYGAIRDLMWEVAWILGDKWAPKLPGDFKGINIASIFVAQTNDNLMTGALNSIGVTPAAWASRVSRNYAIDYANSSVCMAQQMLVNWEQLTITNWSSEVVKNVNSVLGVTNTSSEWDGMVWPYDLMESLAKALSTIAGFNPPGTNPDAGIFIVVSEYESVLNADDGYGDMTALSTVRNNMIAFMTGMAKLKLLPVYTDPASVRDIVNERFHMKRSVFVEDGPFLDHKLHAKVVYVDGELLYTGSDNAYLQYNDQFGVWIEEQDSISAWKKGFFDGLWERAMEVN